MSRGYQVKGVLFDLDGTLTLPGALNFPWLKEQLGCPSNFPVLEYIASLADPEQRQSALAQLEVFELRAAARSQVDPDAPALVRWIRDQGLPVGILTRNSRTSTQAVLERCSDLGLADFDLIISRDDPVAVKPSGDGIRYAAQKWSVPEQSLIMVGDFLFDVKAGLDAGAITVLLDPADDAALAASTCDFRIARLAELRSIIWEGLPLAAGKLPNESLQSYLQEFKFQDPAVLINAGVGEDIAALDVAEEQVLILKSDPITFATDAIGRYAVTVNANDIATAGAQPRWLLTTLLMPCGTTPSLVRSVMQELAQVCGEWSITLCGGHTEISAAVRRPVVVGMMAGTVQRRDLIDKKMMRSGDKVLLTKALAVEGTAIIAREFAGRMLEMGFSDTQIEQGKAFLQQISVVPEARLAARDRLATAMHDVTEGGLATALEELSTAGGHRIRIDLDLVPVFELTREIGAAFGLNPLGLIGSGSLLICCRAEACDPLVQRLQAAGIAGTVIGEVLEAGQGLSAISQGRPASWPRFKVDEIARLFG